MQTWLKNVRMCYKVQRESSCVALRWMGGGGVVVTCVVQAANE